MFKTLLARRHQGYRTTSYPMALPTLPDRYRGRPLIDDSVCSVGCHACADVCPTRAIHVAADGVRLDLGACLFCVECAEVCPRGAITFTNEFRIAAASRSDLVLGATTNRCAVALDAKARSIFGHSLALRQVSAGGCNACESDINVLNTVVFDLARFGIHFVASPRHADGLMITGPVTENMRLALRKTYAAVPAPKLVIAVGACAIAGGPFRDHPEAHNGIGDILPVDLYVPGCPPHPLTILDGLLRLLGRLEEGDPPYR